MYSVIGKPSPQHGNTTAINAFLNSRLNVNAVESEGH